MSLGRLWNNFYEPLQLSFTELRKKIVIFLCQSLLMRCYVTILVEIYSDPIFFGSGPRFVDRIQSDPGFVNPVRSSQGFVNPIRSDPVLVFANAQLSSIFSSQDFCVYYPSKIFRTCRNTRDYITKPFSSFN